METHQRLRPKNSTNLRPKIRPEIELPILAIRESRGPALTQRIDATRTGAPLRARVRTGIAHARELERVRKPTRDRVGETASPLENKSKEGEG